jgi:hypothetical protein
VEQSKARPIGVIIVAILIIINGIILVGGGVFTLYIVTTLANQVTGTLNEDLTQIYGNLSSEIGENLTEGNQTVSLLPTPITSTLLTIGMIVSAIGIAIGVACFVLAWGLFRAKVWAWIITIILAGISIAFGIIAIVGGSFVYIINIIIGGIILYYLYRPNVKIYFGKLKSG